MPTNLLTIIHRDILAAAMILMRIPISWPYDDETSDTAHSYWAFPLIGIAVAAIPALIAATLFSIGIPALASASLMIFGIILMTGGLHHDGLADLGDSFGGSDPEHRLEIMHDSAIGSYGTLALVFIVLIDVSCLAAIGHHDAQMMTQAMIGVAAMSRGMMGFQRWLHTPPNPGGLADRTGAPNQQIMLIGLLLSLLIGIIFLPPFMAFMTMLLGLIVTYALGQFLKNWISGVNGDGLGATQQISEAVMLLLITIVI